MFELDYKDADGCKIYFTKDVEYAVIETLDNVFLIYTFNEKDQCWDWIGNKYLTLKECEEFIRKVR